MTEAEALRLENSILQRRISKQRHELKRLYAEVTALSSLVSRYSKDYYTLQKQVEAERAASLPPADGSKLSSQAKEPKCL